MSARVGRDGQSVAAVAREFGGQGHDYGRSRRPWAAVSLKLRDLERLKPG